jgi:cobalt/nickel transport protein
MKNNKTTVIVLIALALILIFTPLFVIKGAEFAGADGSGSDMVNEIMGGEYEPWFTPVMEVMIGGELPGEMESLLFSIQTGIGVGIISYAFGYLVARKKYSPEHRATQS